MEVAKDKNATTQLGTAVAESEFRINLTALLERASHGETLTVMRGNKPLAQIVAPSPSGATDAFAPNAIERRRAAFVALEKSAAGNRLDGLTIREMIDDGRR